MLMDRLTTFSLRADLTGTAAGATAYSDVLDLSVRRDLGTADMDTSIVFTTLPAGPAGATLNAAIQTSDDNVTYNTLLETAPQPIAQFTPQQPWLFRGELPTGVLRYLRIAYTPSAALTAGAVTAQSGADWPRNPNYPRNYVA